MKILRILKFQQDFQVQGPGFSCYCLSIYLKTRFVKQVETHNMYQKIARNAINILIYKTPVMYM